MDDQEQAAAYAAADWSESHGKIPRYFRERFPQFTRGRVLDLGCGPADVTVRFAKAFPEITMLGVDGSDAMLASGSAVFVKKAWIRVSFSKTTTCRIPPWRSAQSMPSSATAFFIILPILWSCGARPGDARSRALPC
jgi:trans-aconitate methyltransferase